jgi:hypothetical protein
MTIKVPVTCRPAARKQRTTIAVPPNQQCQE